MSWSYTPPAPINPFGSQPAKPVLSSIWKTLGTIIGLIVILLAALYLYNAIVGPTSSISSVSSPDQAPVPLDGKAATVIPAANMPLTSGSDYGVQFWLYIKDWDYKFGKEKAIIRRVDPTNAKTFNPEVSLHPTDNSLDVKVAIFGSSGAAASTPSASNTSSTGDSYTCTVENVPLQSWFSVSITQFQRNLDIYINGKLVKSCVLPGVPRPAVGDVTVGADGGFSGSMCGLHSYQTMLGPADAAGFFAAGTPCQTFAQPGSKTTTEKGSTMTIFGYKFTFDITDAATGKEVQKYSF